MLVEKQWLYHRAEMDKAHKSVFIIRKGIWMNSAEGVICSNCCYKLETTGLLLNCPHCGANMKEEE